MTGARSAAKDPLPDDLVEQLVNATGYPDDLTAAAGVELLQTHISVLFLTSERVYKFRKDVALPFVSFASRAERDADCLREVVLNRRLAPDVYLGVAPLHRRGGTLVIGPPGETLDPSAIEHCVVMRRLPTGRDAQSLLTAGELGPDRVDRLAERIAAFHDGAPLDPPLESEDWQRRCRDPFLDVLALVRDAGVPGYPAAEVDALERRVTQYASRLASLFEARRQAGRGVDGHGDLHLQHVWFEREDDPIVMDCVEFRADLRQIDAACDVANTAMDLRYRGRADYAERFLARYAWWRDDFDLYRAIDFFAAYRAAVRGGVAAVAAQEEELPQAQRSAATGSAREHLALASRLLDVSDACPVLVLLTGTVGSGKSTAAWRVAESIGGVVIGSDRTRKALAGLAPTQHGGSEIYTPDWNERVYRAVLERASRVVASGRSAVLDATFARRAERDRAARWAQERGLEAWLVQTHCTQDEAHTRLAARVRGATESDAGPELLPHSRAGYEPPEEWPRAHWIRVDTSGSDWESRLSAQLDERLATSQRVER